MNELTTETRNKLKIGVLLIAMAVLVIYGTVMYFKYAPTQAQEKPAENNTVVFSQPTLTFFSLQEQLALFPDRIMIHDPYLVVVRPDEWKSEIYNMQTKKKEKEVNEVILDYSAGNSVYNKQGFETYYNKKNLNILCDQAFIKSPTEILCVTRPDTNKKENELLVVNTQTLSQEQVYKPSKVITAIYYDKDIMYVGEYDFAAQKALIVVNNLSSSVDDLINVIYPMNNKLYAASFKSLRNKKVESYYEIRTVDKKVSTKLVQRGEIVFYN
jgi:uncharacterized protein YqfB (UPF0267 family)